MTAATHPAPSVARAPIPLWSRIYGFGSVFAKSFRDSRLAVLIVSGLTGGLLFVVSAGIGQVMPTQAARDEIVRLATDLGGLTQGLAGKPVHIDALGGYLQWKYGPVFVIVAGLWSILILSSTLAAEARRGSLELVAVAPIGRRRLALEKIAAHLVGMSIVTVVLTLAAVLAGAAFGTLPVDTIPLEGALGFALWVGLVALTFGTFALALSQLLGRGAAAGISGAILFAGYLLSNYQATTPGFPPLASLTPWGWTLDHLALAGQYDWPSLVLPAAAIVVFLVIGVMAFERRDLGATTALPVPGLPAATLGLREPVGRSLGDRLPTALGWGLGVGAMGLVFAALSAVVAEALADSSDLLRTLGAVFPEFDIGSAGGFLQLTIQILFIVAGFAAATLVAGWASDETSGRLEVLLTTPVSRRGWVIRSGIGVLLAIGVMTLLIAIGVGIGAATTGSDALTPALGTLVLGLYALALAGIGFAVGGFRASLAAEAVAAVVIVTYLIDLLAPAFSLPSWVHELALTSHLGQPMVGIWDWAGMALCALIAVGGLALGAWAMERRDVAR
jgi:ABC-2 type transport system permease protein